MPTHKEKYGHDGMTIKELEERASADMYEIVNRLNETDAKVIGNLIWGLMSKFRQAYRTAALIIEEDYAPSRTTMEA